MLGDGGSLVEKAVQQKSLGIGKAEDDVGAKFGGNELHVVAGLLLIQLLWLPWLLFDQRLGFGDLSALGRIPVVDVAAAGGAFGIGVHQNAATGVAEGIADVEGHAAGADDGNAWAVTKGNGIVARHEYGVEHGAGDTRVLMRRDADAWGQAGVDGELGGV